MGIRFVNKDNCQENTFLKTVHINLGFDLPVQCTEIEEAFEMAKRWCNGRLNEVFADIDLDDGDENTELRN